MSLRVEANRLNPSDQKTSQLHPGIMSADDIRRVKNIVDGAKQELKAKAENDRIIESTKAEVQILKKQALSAGIAAIFGIDPSKTITYLTEKELGRIEVDFSKKCLKIDALTFNEVILKTFKAHPELTKCNLRVCDVQSMTYITDLFKAVIQSQIREIYIPRKMTPEELRQMNDTNDELVKLRRPIMKIRVVAP